MAAARSETAAEVAKMQRDINAGTRAMANDFDQFARSVQASMGKVGATTDAVTAQSVRKFDEISRAANRTQVSLDALGSASGDMATKMEAAWAASAAVADSSADQQVDAIHRVEAAMAASRFMPDPGSSVRGPAARQFIAGRAGTHQGPLGETTVRIDGAQYTGLITALQQVRGNTYVMPVTSSSSSSTGAPPSSGSSPLSTAALLGFLTGGGHATHRVGLPFMRFGLPVLGAPVGTPASFAGLGAEHVLMTLLGLAGTAVGAGVGVGLLGGGMLAKLLVGSGSDIMAMKTAAGNVKSVTTAMDAYSTAVATYGANSSQAATAQKQLNFAIQDVPPAVRASTVALAKGNIALQDYWKAASVGAVNQANQLFLQIQQVAHTYVPLVANAAQQNLSIINTGLKPLFAWLQGPQGIGIFHDLENQFAQQLPTSVHAFSQAIEFVIRLFDQASHSTGGLSTYLDHLFTRLNSLSNPQIDQIIKGFVHDFDLWKNLVKALVTDIRLLFSNDVGTAQGILTTLTNMLQKVGQWERTITARQQMTTIFQVHKDEVIALLHLMGLLLPTFLPIYMTLAPPLTKVFTILVTGLSAVIRLLEKIPGGTWIIGLTLLSSKLFGIGKTVGWIRDGIAALLGGGGLLSRLASTVNKLPGGPKVTSAIANAGSRSVTGVTEVATMNVADMNVARMNNLPGAPGAPGAPGVPAEPLPIPPAAGAPAETTGFIQAMRALAADPAALAALALPIAGFVAMAPLAVGQHPMDLTKLTPSSPFYRQLPPGVPHMYIDPGRASALTPPTIAAMTPLQQAMATLGVTNSQQGMAAMNTWLKNAQNANFLQGLSVTQMNAMIARGKALEVLYPGMAAQIDKYNAKIRAQDQATAALNQTMVNNFNSVAIAKNKLPALYDAFRTNMARIAQVLGLDSAAGRMAMEKNVSLMIGTTQKQMLAGQVSVQQGMKAIEYAIDTAMQHGALTATQATSRILAELRVLHAKGKITATQFATDITDTYTKYAQKGANIWGDNTKNILNTLYDLRKQSKITVEQMTTDVTKIWTAGVAGLNRQTDKWYQHQKAVVELERKNHVITAAAENADLAQLEAERVNNSKANLIIMTENMYNSAAASGKVSLSGLQALRQQFNDLLHKAGSNFQIPAPNAATVTMAQYTLRTGLTQNQGPGPPGMPHARGGYTAQVGRAGQRGSDSVPMMIGDQRYMVAPGEKIAVFNDTQQAIADRRFADFGGMEGFFNRVNPLHGSAPPRRRFAAGGYVYPWPAGTTPGRIDMGQDASMPVGAPIGPIGDARIGGIAGGWYAGQPIMWWTLTSGPAAGRSVYLAEQITPLVSPGQTVKANQAIARFAPFGTGIEMGWSTGSEVTLAQQQGNLPPGNSNTPAGQSFAAFLAGLSHGQLVLGGGAGAAPTLKAPLVHGGATTTHDMMQSGFNKIMGPLNAQLQKHWPMPTFGPGSFGPGPASLAPIEKYWIDAGGPASAAHVAAAIAMAESGGRNIMQQGQPPGLTGWGLWQITPTSGIPGGPYLLNPLTNAQKAVQLYRQAGGFSPWVTFNDGAYLQFMSRGGMASPAGFAQGGILTGALREQVQMMRDQHKLLGSLPPFAGSFARGGDIPGPKGSPRLIIGHGGEHVGEKQAPIIVQIGKKDGVLERLIDMRIEQYGRRISRQTSRGLISGGGY